MSLKEHLAGEPLFADPKEEEVFRRSLRKWIRADGGAVSSVRVVVFDGPAPVRAGEVLAAVWSRRPVLLASAGWGRWTWDAFRRAIETGGLPPGTVLFRTGGSSGEPKFALHDWETLETAARSLRSRLGGRPLSSGLDLPLHHVGGWMPVIRAAVSGGRVAAADRSAPGALPGLRVASVVPTTLYRILSDEDRTERLRAGADLILAGGAAFPDDLLAAARSRGLPLSLVYGMTETAGLVAMQEPADFLSGEPPSVRPFGANRIRIVGGNEIRIESPQLFRGYLGGPRRTGGGWRTGDAGREAGGGRFVVEGRLGRFASTGGETVSLGRIEEAARSLPEVGDAWAAAVPDPEWGSRILLFVASRARRDWRRELRARLDPPEIPAEIRTVPEIPRSGAGKVDPDRLFG
ncbi:MAG: AMP-binding protein [Puniceicoccaceae bacterium]